MGEFTFMILTPALSDIKPAITVLHTKMIDTRHESETLTGEVHNEAANYK